MTFQISAIILCHLWLCIFPSLFNCCLSVQVILVSGCQFCYVSALRYIIYVMVLGRWPSAFSLLSFSRWWLFKFCVIFDLPLSLRLYLSVYGVSPSVCESLCLVQCLVWFHVSEFPVLLWRSVSYVSVINLCFPCPVSPDSSQLCCRPVPHPLITGVCI